MFRISPTLKSHFYKISPLGLIYGLIYIFNYLRSCTEKYKIMQQSLKDEWRENNELNILLLESHANPDHTRAHCVGLTIAQRRRVALLVSVHQLNLLAELLAPIKQLQFLWIGLNVKSFKALLFHLGWSNYRRDCTLGR